MQKDFLPFDIRGGAKEVLEIEADEQGSVYHRVYF